MAPCTQYNPNVRPAESQGVLLGLATVVQVLMFSLKIRKIHFRSSHGRLPQFERTCISNQGLKSNAFLVILCS